MIWPVGRDPGAFCGLASPPAFAEARFAVLPIPYDGTSTWLKGSDRGPDAILAASANMELFDIETLSEPWRHGIITMAEVEGGGWTRRLEEIAVLGALAGLGVAAGVASAGEPATSGTAVFGAARSTSGP